MIVLLLLMSIVLLPSGYWPLPPLFEKVVTVAFVVPPCEPTYHGP
jgi:hypothetical protein